MSIAQYHDSSYDKFIGQKISFSGRVVAEPDARETTVHLIVKPERGEKILVITGRYPEYHYGNTLRVTGKLIRPENFVTDQGKIFDYENYLAKDDLYYELIYPEIKLEKTERTFLGMLYVAKQKFLDNLARALPEPHAALLGGITIGAKQNLDEQTTDLFRTVGLSHVIVLSGYNITIVAQVVMRALSRLPFLYGTVLGALAIILFIVMTGASSTAVRAGIMALVALLGKITGREYDALRALLIAALVMILANPKLLFYDLSFQFSFLATFGVIVGPPILEKYFRHVPKRWGVRETLATTLSAQLLVLPWILYKMGQLSLVGLPVNLLVLPTIPLTMFLGSIAGPAGFVGYVVSLPFAYLAYVPLEYLLTISRLFAAVPFAAVSISNFPLWLTVFIYIVFGFIIYRFNKKQTPTEVGA